MGAKSKPQKIRGPKVAKPIWLYFIYRTTWRGDTWVPPQIFGLFPPPKNPRMEDFKPQKIL